VPSVQFTTHLIQIKSAWIERAALATEVEGDFGALGDYGFATYCRGETVRQGGNLIMPMAANVPVEIAGVGIMPGDYIYADASGAVVVPAAEIREVLEEAVQSEIRDQASADRMIHEDPATVITQGETR